MYNIKINTLPVLTKLVQKINGEALPLTDKEIEKLRKEIISSYGKLVAISYFRKDGGEWLSYIGPMAYVYTKNNTAEVYDIPIGTWYDNANDLLKPYCKITFDIKNKQIMVSEL